MGDTRNSASSDDGRWRAQNLRREAALESFVIQFCAACDADDPDRAEALARRITVGELLTRGIELHKALSLLEHPEVFGRMITPEYPSIVLTIAIARVEAAGSLAGLSSVMRATAKQLVARRTEAVAPRARDLSIAAFLLLMTKDGERMRELTRRGGELVSAVEIAPSDPEELVLAAADLAMTCVLTEQYDAAMRMWSLIRAWVVAPTHPALMQADWGLSIVGVIIADRSLISPITRPVLSPTSRLDHEAQVASARDAWWALVQVARAWTAMDELDAARALELTTQAKKAVTNPRRIAPLGTMHALALLMAGQPAGALDFLSTQADARRVIHTPDRSWRTLVAVMATALNGDDTSELLGSSTMRRDDAMRHVARGYSWLLTGAPDARADTVVELPEHRSLRLHTLAGLVRAAVELRLGNEQAALAAYDKVASLHAARGSTGWALLLPDSDVQALRALAERSGHPDVASTLPRHTHLHAVEQPVTLTEREQEVLHLLQRGKTNAQIAASLFISPNTVKFHVANILKRLGVATRDEAAALGGGGVRKRADGTHG